MKKIGMIMAAAWLLCGCVEEGADLGVARAPILYGEEAGNADFGSVVALVISRGNGDNAYYAYCSGVLIAENVVLTAAHCLVDDEGFPFGSLYRDHKIAVVADVDAGAPEAGRVYEIDRYRVNSDYDSLTNMNDIGVVWLRSAVAADVARPLPVVTDFSKVKAIVDQKQDVMFVGYGVDESGAYNKRRVFTGTLDAWCTQSWCEISDVRMPYGTLKSSLKDGGPCSGDSGGAVLVMMDGVQQVVAVTSSGDEHCADFSIATSVAAHQRWLNDTLYPKKKDSGCAAMVRTENYGLFELMFMILILLGKFANRKRSVIKRISIKSSL